jgi:hypothetical protein
MPAPVHHKSVPDPQSTVQPVAPTKPAKNISGFEAWIARSGLRTFDAPTPKNTVDNLTFDSTESSHLLVNLVKGKPTILADTAPPSTPGAYGVNHGRPHRISDDRPHRVSKSKRMASPSSERRREVTKHF